MEGLSSQPVLFLWTQFAVCFYINWSVAHAWVFFLILSLFEPAEHTECGQTHLISLKY